MKLRLYITISLLIWSFEFLAAQHSIFESLSTHEEGRGDVYISQPVYLRRLVEPSLEVDSSVRMIEYADYFLASGYRVQVFAGNNQKLSKDEAFTKKSQIDQLYEESVPTYVDYNAPFWMLRVGDYLTYEEAFCMMHRLMSSFPAFGKEINIIRADVRVPLY
jgi:hypothetical protein